MAPRRPLTEGLKSNTLTADPVLEKQFVYQSKDEEKLLDKPVIPPATPAPAEKREGKGQAPINRVGFSTKLRSDYFAALKRASLERLLAGEEPHTIQDILEQTLEPWLREHGYLK